MHFVYGLTKQILIMQNADYNHRSQVRFHNSTSSCSVWCFSNAACNIHEFLLEIWFVENQHIDAKIAKHVFTLYFQMVCWNLSPIKILRD